VTTRGYVVGNEPSYVAEASGVEVAVEGEAVRERRRAEGRAYLYRLAAQQLGWRMRDVKRAYDVREQPQSDGTVDGWSALLTLTPKETTR
jgi:predicted transcriptional regulator